MDSPNAKPADIAPLTKKPAHRHFQWLGLAALGVCLAAWAMRTVAPAAPPLPAKYHTVKIVRGDVEQVVRASGKLQLYKYADVVAQIAGRVDDVLVGIGEDVKGGKLLLTIEPSQKPARADSNQAQLARLRAELAEQQAQLDFADLQYKRQTQLKADNATREESFEASRTAWYAAQARVDAINARIKQVELSMRDDQDVYKHTQVTAPIAGTIVSLAARPGQAVSANQQSSALMRIADMSKLTVQARVAEIDVPRLHKGMIAHFSTPGYPGRQWEGKVRQIIPVPAEGSGEQGKETFYNVLFEVANPERQLMSGMSTQVDFVLAQAHGVSLVPVAALGKADADGAYTIAVMEPDKQLHKRQIRIGLRGVDTAQVIAGLAPAEEVAVGLPAAALQALPPSPAAQLAAAAGPLPLPPQTSLPAAKNHADRYAN